MHYECVECDWTGHEDDLDGDCCPHCGADVQEAVLEEIDDRLLEPAA